MMKLYHYTDQDGLRGIKKDGFIRASTSSNSSSKDFLHGPGVYLTTLNPDDYTKQENENTLNKGEWKWMNYIEKGSRTNVDLF